MIAWFDDVRVGMRFKTGEKRVTRDDIVRFATEFDPQPFHLDEAAAAQSAPTPRPACRLRSEARPADTDHGWFQSTCCGLRFVWQQHGITTH